MNIWYAILHGVIWRDNLPAVKFESSGKRVYINPNYYYYTIFIHYCKYNTGDCYLYLYQDQYAHSKKYFISQGATFKQAKLPTTYHCFYVQGGKISLQFWNFPQNTNIFQEWASKFYIFLTVPICDPTRANEALWGDIKTDILNSTYFSISKEHFGTKTIFISYSYQKLDNLIWNCLITLKTNYQDMGRQSYWFVHKPIEDIKNNGIKTWFPVTYWIVWVYELIEFLSKFVF